MRDTARARIDRAQRNAEAMIETLKKGRNKVIRSTAPPSVGMQKAREFAELATAAVHAPKHGAEFARAMLHFAESLYDNSALAAEIGELFDNEHVIWRPADQLAAAHKQIGRLRSDVQRWSDEDVRTIPIETLVYADNADDFIGRTYVQLDNVEIAVKDSQSNPLRVKANGRLRSIPVEALRYVEGRMIRPR